MMYARALVFFFSRALQISHNNWLPMTLPLYPSLIRVTAIRASVRALSFQSTLDLQELTLDHSLIRPPPPSQQSQTAVFEDLCRRAPSLRYLSCNNCSLQVEQTPHSESGEGSSDAAAGSGELTSSDWLPALLVLYWQTDIFQFLSSLSYKCSALVVSLQFNSVSLLHGKQTREQTRNTLLGATRVSHRPMKAGGNGESRRVCARVLLLIVLVVTVSLCRAYVWFRTRFPASSARTPSRLRAASCPLLSSSSTSVTTPV